MSLTNGTLTLNGVKQKKEIAKRFLADGRYLISGEGRSGGIASVFRVFDTQEEKHVALKVFRSANLADPVAVSYTHLDVYKRQVSGSSRHARPTNNSS